MARLYNQSVSGRVALLPGTELRPVDFNKRQQNEEAFFQKHSWRVHVSPMPPSFPYWKHCFQCHFLFFKMQILLVLYTVGNFLTKIRARKQSQKICEQEQASTYDHCSSKGFCEHFEQRPNFASTFKLDGTILNSVFPRYALSSTWPRAKSP